MGAVITLLYEAVARERERRLAMAEQVERSHRQLAALNQTIQANLNRIYDDLDRSVEEEQRQLASMPPGPAKERLASLIQRVREVTATRYL